MAFYLIAIICFVAVGTRQLGNRESFKRSSLFVTILDSVYRFPFYPWCSRLESNQRPPPYQGGALPTELRERAYSIFERLGILAATFASPVRRRFGPAPAALRAVLAHPALIDHPRIVTQWSGRRESNPH